jgi:hypothetical protein
VTTPGATYPYTIDNGDRERLTFVRRVAGPAGDRLEVENLVEPGSGPPMHVHHHQEEALTIEHRVRDGRGPRAGTAFRLPGAGDRGPVAR